MNEKVTFSLSRKTYLNLIKNYWMLGDVALLQALREIASPEFHPDYGGE